MSNDLTYFVIHSKNQLVFERLLSDYLNTENWKLAGGVSVIAGSEANAGFYQAIERIKK